MIKKICRKIKIKKLKSGVMAETWETLAGNDFIVIFSDGTTKRCIDREELYNCLEKDHIKRIHYIFDMTDRIILERDIIINTEEVK